MNLFVPSLLAAASALAFVLLAGPFVIAWLARYCPEPIKGDSPRLCALNQAKRATPTMGGLLILAPLLFAIVLLGDLHNGYLQAALVLLCGLGALGAADDLIKLRCPANGLTARGKLAGQLVVCLVAAILIDHHYGRSPQASALFLPLGLPAMPLGIFYVPLATVVLTATSNAVNLTDGLDGLASGCLLFAIAVLALACALAATPQWAAHFGIPATAAATGPIPLAGAMLGGVAGFLWFNRHPARVFMGDTGALPLGGLLGLLALAARQEWLLLIVGGVFVAEAGSVVVQVTYYRWRRRRIFLCAPLHHHYQFAGWSERQIVHRFWLAAAICATVGLALLRPDVVLR